MNSSASFSNALSRRRFLRNLGVGVALPFFASSRAGRLLAANTTAPLATTASGAPLRTAFLYVPNGVHQGYWWPEGLGRDFAFNQTMKPLERLKDSLQVLGGLDHTNAEPGADGPGDHARANATYLTGVRARKATGADLHLGISIDQVMARHVGHLTRFPSLELSCESLRRSGSCDNGYSCAYQYNIAWRSETIPMAAEANPRLVFERLFGAGTDSERRDNFLRRQKTNQSVLDFVLEDTRSLQNELGRMDRQKLDEYLSSVRDIEQRINRSLSFGEPPAPGAGVVTPPDVPADYAEHVELMSDLLVLAFQTDSTRVATFMLAHDGNNRPFPHIGIAEGHHHLSHHRGDVSWMEKLAQIDLWYVEQFARFLDKLRDAKDVDGSSILDNSMIVYGSGHADGNKHSHDNLPIILAGGGGGVLNPGQHLNFGARPTTDLFLSLVDRMGIEGVRSFGDSTGRVTGI